VTNGATLTVNGVLDAPIETSPDVLDWAQVRSFRRIAADRLADELRGSEGVTEQRRREVGRRIIQQILDEHVRAAYQAGDRSLTPDIQDALAKAIFDALLGLGRLQPLVDDDRLENVEVFGCEKVVTIDHHGHTEELPPVADTEEELREMLANLASRAGTERTFTENNPVLHLALPGGARLAAIGNPVAAETAVNIRVHRLVNVTLEDLAEEYGTLTPELAAFLRAAVLARRSILVAGVPNSGKTTLVRALAQAIDPADKIATFETEYELRLNELLAARVRKPIALAARPGSGLPMASKVLRPMIMGLPMVTRLKYFRSAGICQGMPPSLPIARFSPMATTSEIFMASPNTRAMDRIHRIFQNLQDSDFFYEMPVPSST
jgi:energy-coupling factor transporter ATP-binding protein EcfA2